MKELLTNYGPRLLNCVILTAIGLLLIKILLKIFQKTLQRSRISVTMHRFLFSIVKIGLVVLLIIMVLDAWGVPVASLLTVFGVVGAAASLAAKDSLSNVAGGIILLISKPFEVGDYIQVEGMEGTVAYINILNTKINTFDNKAIYIPNGRLSTNEIVNFTHEQQRRLDLTFSIGYQEDFQQAKQLISEIVAAHPMALAEPAPVIRVGAHSPSSIDIAAKVWVDSENYWSLKYDLLESVKLKFDEKGISIPYQQLDVHLFSSDNEEKK